jgi:hypothetical protein
MQPVFEMLLACVDDESALYAQGRVRHERRRIKNSRACIQMTEMLLQVLCYLWMPVPLQVLQCHQQQANGVHKL